MGALGCILNIFNVSGNTKGHRSSRCVSLLECTIVAGGVGAELSHIVQLRPHRRHVWLPLSLGRRAGRHCLSEHLHGGVSTHEGGESGLGLLDVSKLVVRVLWERRYPRRDEGSGDLFSLDNLQAVCLPVLHPQGADGLQQLLRGAKTPSVLYNLSNVS